MVCVRCFARTRKHQSVSCAVSAGMRSCETVTGQLGGVRSHQRGRGEARVDTVSSSGICTASTDFRVTGSAVSMRRSSAASARARTFRYIRPTHEEMAALMACAHAKFTGEVGVCIATSGPGAVHLMNGLYDAACDNQPVVAIVGQQARVAMGATSSKSSTWSGSSATSPSTSRRSRRRCRPSWWSTGRCGSLRRYRKPTVIILPADVQDLEMEEPALEHWVSRTGVGHASTRIAPPQDELDRAAAVLNAGHEGRDAGRPGCARTRPTRSSRSPSGWAGIVTALLGKGAVPGDVPVPHPAARAARLASRATT